MPTTILQRDNAQLRQHAVTVPVEDIPTADMQQCIADMHAALAQAPHGVALAAPQIGISKRIFIVSHRAFQRSDANEDTDHRADQPALVAINPEITRRSRASDRLEEGCLSVHGTYGYIRRSRKVTIRAYDAAGEQYTRGASGLLAQIFQHEIDHLDGILFTDKAEETWSNNQ